VNSDFFDGRSLEQSKDIEHGAKRGVVQHASAASFQFDGDPLQTRRRLVLCNNGIGGVDRVGKDIDDSKFSKVRQTVVRDDLLNALAAGIPDPSIGAVRVVHVEGELSDASSDLGICFE